MKNRANIEFTKTDKGFIGSLNTGFTFLIAKGDSKRQIRKEIKETLREF